MNGSRSFAEHATERVDGERIARQRSLQTRMEKAAGRVRALEGTTILPNRRVSMHLMAQPDVAALSPDSTSGTRFWRELPADMVLHAYNALMLTILRRELPIAESGGGVTPGVIELSDKAKRIWIAFSDHVETRMKEGGELEPIRGLANKLAEHAARLAAVLAAFSDLEAGEIGPSDIECGIALAQHYAAEALRLFQAGQVGAELRLAQRALAWIREQPDAMFFPA